SSWRPRDTLVPGGPPDDPIPRAVVAARRPPRAGPGRDVRVASAAAPVVRRPVLQRGPAADGGTRWHRCRPSARPGGRPVAEPVRARAGPRPSGGRLAPAARAGHRDAGP